MRNICHAVVFLGLIIFSFASNAGGQAFPYFPAATQQPYIVDFAASSTTVPNGYYGTAVVTGYSSQQYATIAVSADGQTYNVNQYLASYPLTQCSPAFADLCGVGVANFKGTLYLAYADTAQDLVIAQGTPIPGNPSYSWSILQTITGTAVTTVPSLTVYQGKLLIIFGASSYPGVPNAFYQVTCSVVGATCSAPDPSYLGGSYLGVASYSTPGLSELNGDLYLAVQNQNSTHALVLYKTSDGVNWSFVTSTGWALGTGVQMVTYNNNLVIASQQNNSQHNLWIFTSPNGSTWYGQQNSSIQLGGPPGLTLINGGVALALKQNNRNNHLFTSFGY